MMALWAKVISEFFLSNPCSVAPTKEEPSERCFILVITVYEQQVHVITQVIQQTITFSRLAIVLVAAATGMKAQVEKQTYFSWHIRVLLYYE
jgi:hypothetical protein